jgi:hypothetical protein
MKVLVGQSNSNSILSRVMIHYHLNIQLFTILPMWQGGPPLLFQFFFFLKKIN